MLKEYHYDHLIRWPHGERAAVFLTFDFQGGEDVKPDKNGILNYEMWSQGEYGPHHAIYRLLRILKEENVKLTEGKDFKPLRVEAQRLAQAGGSFPTLATAGAADPGGRPWGPGEGGAGVGVLLPLRGTPYYWRAEPGASARLKRDFFVTASPRGWA